MSSGPARPSLQMLRSLTDEHVLRALMAAPRTRAQLAAATGISKPTVSESVRRLVLSRAVVDTGERTSARGGVGSYYALDPGTARALVVAVAPDGVVVEVVDWTGGVTYAARSPIRRPAQPARVARLLRRAVRSAAEATAGPLGTAVVSAADPVDRVTGRLRHLPDAPFLVGELSPVDVLGPLVQGPVVVDNDVNWAARAERDAHPGGGLDDFAYLYLGEGLGCAVVSDGAVRRGHTGLAGEVAHVLTAGVGWRPMALTEVFARLQLRQPGSTAIDVDLLLARLAGRSERALRLQAALGGALAGVVSALVALCDPGVVVLSGPWGSDAVVVDAVRRAVATQPRPVTVRAGAVTGEPSRAGARSAALSRLRDAIVAAAAGAPAARG